MDEPAKPVDAFWSVSLDVDCPHCGQYVNLLDASDFWDGRPFDIAEHGTKRTKAVDLMCPECGKEITCDLQY